MPRFRRRRRKQVEKTPYYISWKLPCSPYKYYEASCFVGQNSDYFMERNLHIHRKIQTVGRIVYAAENILLECLDKEGNILLNVQAEKIPTNGSYAYVFGTFNYFQDLSRNEVYNFEMPSEQFIVILDIPIWNEMHEGQARILEKLLCSATRRCLIK